jgi:hypothetical protein
MTAPQYMKVENGIFALSLVDTAAVGYSPTWMSPGGVDIATITEAAYTDNNAGWRCQVTSAFLAATANTTTEDVPAGWCGAGQSVTQVNESTFDLNLTFVQDGHLPDGLTEFAYVNDTKEAYFLYGLDAVSGLPKVMGRCRILAGQIGGAAGTILTADVVWPCSPKPEAAWPPVVVAAATTTTRDDRATAAA